MQKNTPSAEAGKNMIALTAILNIVIIEQAYLSTATWYLWLIVSLPLLVISARFSAIRER